MANIPRIEAIAAALIGIAVAAAAKLGFVVLVLLITAIIMPFGVSPGEMGSLWWCIRFLASPVGWIHYVAVGSLAGWLCWKVGRAKPKASFAISIIAIVLLWLFELLWYRGSYYHFNLNILEFVRLIQRMISIEYWVNMAPLYVVWLLPHIVLIISLPLWLRRLHPSVVGMLQQRLR
jgi:hypothetical protein